MENRTLYYPEQIDDARAEAKALGLLLVNGYDGCTDLDYLRAMTMEEYLEEKQWCDGSVYRGWITILEDYRMAM